MAQVDKLPVNELPVTQSVASSDKVMVLTDNTNNIVNNITIADLNDSNISSDADNSIETGSDGKLYVESPEVITGDLTDLATDDKTNLVAAINEVDGDISTVETTTGDLNDLETLTKTSLVDAINEIYNTQAPQLQADYVRTAKAMLENTTAYSNSTIYSDVYSYNHSTFDLSKFTVGDSVITKDGIMTGMPSTGVKVPISFKSGQITKFKLQYTHKASSELQFILASAYNNDGQKNLYLQASSTNVCKICYSAIDHSINNFIFVDGHSYQIEILTDFSQYVKVIIDDIERYSDINAGINYGLNDYLALGNNKSLASNRNIAGSLDLKQFSITVDGYPIFSGNKTGLDTIKPADYTITGTPTISADGVATGLGNNNYLNTNIVIGQKPFKIRAKVNYPNTISGQRIFQIGLGGNQTFQVFTQIYGSNPTQLRMGGTLSDDTTFADGIADISGDVIAEFEFTGSEYILRAYNVAGTLLGSKTITSNLYIKNVDTLDVLIGTNATDITYDLNSFKIYVDGNLVYQSCLLIPYNQSSTGSKIVDVAYRDRVTDVYQQYGKALYYTIDETNENITLPMGEVYGFIEENTKQVNINTSAIATKQTVGDWCTTAPTTVATATLNKPVVIVDNYLNGTDGYIKFSDGLIIQWGHFDGSSGTVNLIRNFATTDYDIQIKINNSNSSPNTQYYYTTKSNNSFTVGAHSTSFPFDWFAIGH